MDQNKKTTRSSCPMDCFDTCALSVTTIGDRITKVEGDSSHPLTRGYICSKGKRLLDRHNHPRRLRTPLIRTPEGFVPVTMEKALGEIASRLEQAVQKHGSQSILNYSGDGYGGVVKTVDSLFFNLLGGVTTPAGNLCWGAGTKAQKIDFGDVRGHDPEEFSRVKTLLLWGRNPGHTSIHLAEKIKTARKNGAKVILIDPVKSASASLAHKHVKVRPAGDGALALGMARIILDEDLLDHEFIEKNVKGFSRFKKYLKTLSMEELSEVSGVDIETMDYLARVYAQGRPSSIIIGLGLQRYENGGNNVRCIDALGALTGFIGKSSGGVNYASNSITRFMDTDFAETSKYAVNSRTFPLPDMAGFLEKSFPSIQCMFISKANPLTQIQDVGRTVRAFRKVPFKVVFDIFMTDTAREADLILPVTTVFEEEDLFFNSMFNPYLNYIRPAAIHPEEVSGEFDIYRKLAERMNLSGYPQMDRTSFLEKAMAPLTDKYGVTLEGLKEGFFKVPGREIPWEDGVFETPSGKYELCSEIAADMGLPSHPELVLPRKPDKDFPLRLITPHGRDSINSQHAMEERSAPVLHIHPDTADTYGISGLSHCFVKSRHGCLRTRVKQDKEMQPDIIKIVQGRWHKNGSVNVLTGVGLSDMGDQATYYDCFCSVY